MLDWSMYDSRSTQSTTHKSSGRLRGNMAPKPHSSIPWLKTQPKNHPNGIWLNLIPVLRLSQLIAYFLCLYPSGCHSWQCFLFVLFSVLHVPLSTSLLTTVIVPYYTLTCLLVVRPTRMKICIKFPQLILIEKAENMTSCALTGQFSYAPYVGR